MSSILAAGKKFCTRTKRARKAAQIAPIYYSEIKNLRAALEKAAQQQLLQLIIPRAHGGRARSDILSLHQPECNSKVNLLKPSKKKRQLGFSDIHTQKSGGWMRSPALSFAF
jgi:hypothetical protein